MYYDVNIEPDFLMQEADDLEGNEYMGFCINKIIKASELRSYVHSPLNLRTNKSVYSRLEVRFCESDALCYEPKKMVIVDLFVVKLYDVCGMDKIVKLQPDMMSFDYAGRVLLFKPRIVKLAIREGIFFEIPLRECFRHGTISTVWMGNVRRLLSITNGKNIVVSSCAKRFTDMKKLIDVAKTLEFFGLKNKRAVDVLKNSSRLLERCALRRYSYKNTVIHDLDEGILKRDFVLPLYKNVL